MAYTTIDDPSAHFQTGLYAGTGSELVITNNGNSNLQPDLMWIKNRTDGSTNHHWHDTSRGTTVTLFGNKTDAEETQAQSVKSVQSDGFTLGTWDGNNIDNKNFVAWQWKANGGTTTSVSASGTGEASINASTHQANTTAGISIITYTGRDDQISAGQETKLTHGLGVVPRMFICKRRDGASNWYVLGNNATETSGFYWSYNEHLLLNQTASVNGVNNTGNKAPDSTYIYLGNVLVNTVDSWIGYAFAEKQGFSKFDKYVGNGNASGPFVYTGFKPAFVMVKIIDTNSGLAGEWQIYDHKRPGYNFPNYNLSPNNDTAEYTGSSYHNMDLLSNGFKILLTDVAVNTSGKIYGYAAFAENPFVTSDDGGSIPTTAR